MYQFYYADISKEYNRIPCKDDVRNHFHISAVRPTMWEEHCLECSAPLCFESCVHYAPRKDGRCKRFDNGLLVFDDTKACCGQGVHVKFRQWGNMMTVLFPAMLEENEYVSLKNKNQKLGNLFSKINNSPFPQKIRWECIRIPEFLRRRNLRKISGIDNTADAFLFHGYSYTEESFSLIVEVYDENTSVYKTSIAISKGENLKIISNLPEACSKSNYLVKIYPENNIEAELDILWCDFVKGRAIASEKPADKVKCLVWDLDNTLWDGTLIETDDPKTLELKPGVIDTIKELDNRGIIQSIASKNSFEPAMEVLKGLGIDEYFLYPQINWNPKSDSMEQIAKCLNIGINSLAFIDDAHFERNQVNSVWPQIRVYDANEVSSILNNDEFNVTITEEGKKRRLMYRAEEQRHILQESNNTDITEFLKQCKLCINIFEPTTPEARLRCYELVVRTNQLNMTGVKYSNEEFDKVISRPEHKNFAFSCSDSFGEYGIVGYGQYRTENKTLIFTEFAMSCRVAGKFVESALFSHLLNSENCETGVFPVQITKKNILLRNSLESIGFAKADFNDAHISYQFDSKLLNSNIVKVN